MLAETYSRTVPDTKVPVHLPVHVYWLDSVTLYGTIGLLLFGPLAFGAVESWSLLVDELGAVLLFLLWAVRQAISREPLATTNPLFLPMASFAALIFVQIAIGATAYPYVTRSHALLYTAYGLLVFLVVQCVRRTSQVNALAFMISAYGFALAMFALLQGLSSNGKLYWVRSPQWGGWIYGPYVNHNHYAGLMEMLTPIPLVFSLTRYAHGARRTLGAVSAAMMAGTIFLSGSRGGMAAFLVQMTVLAVIVATQKKRKSAFAQVIFLMIVCAVLVRLGGAELTRRVLSVQTEAQAELSGGTRMEIYHDAFQMFKNRPILGWGLGTFPTVYPQFRSFYTTFFVNATHNDYLQLLTEMGGLGFVVMLWFMVIVYRNAIRKLKDWPSTVDGPVALAAMLGCTGIVVHSFVDFNLQIPANAALFYTFCTLATMEPRFRAFRRSTCAASLEIL
jgi:O-antigen ligase